MHEQVARALSPALYLRTILLGAVTLSVSPYLHLHDQLDNQHGIFTVAAQNSAGGSENRKLSNRHNCHTVNQIGIV